MTDHYGPLIAERDGLKVIDCRACGWAHLDPLPDEAKLAAYYTDEFWQKDKAGWLARYEAQREWDEMRAGDWIGIAETLTAGRTLLDIGSGYGQFIEVAGRRGWRAVGVEANTAAVEYARGRGLGVRPGIWDEVKKDYGDLDCISALWILEHLLDPEKFLRGIDLRLANRGLLVLAIPNEFNRDQYLANEHAAVHDWFVHKTHVNYFTPATIGNLLGRRGFVIVDMLATYPIERHIPDGEDYTGRPDVGDELHEFIRKGELAQTQAARVDIQRARVRIGIGRDLIIFARPT